MLNAIFYSIVDENALNIYLYQLFLTFSIDLNIILSSSTNFMANYEKVQNYHISLKDSQT